MGYRSPNIADWFQEEVYRELRDQDRQNRQYRTDLIYHSDCRDPDHPGCWKCEPEYYEDFEDKDDGQGSPSGCREQ